MFNHFFDNPDMRALRLRHLLGFCAIAQLTVLPAIAQQAPKDAPPQMEKLEEGESPAVTIRPPSTGKTTITEKRAPGGKRTEVKVTSGKGTYYLNTKDQPGAVQYGDAQGMSNQPAQWEVMTFDLNNNRKTQQQQTDATSTKAPPPPQPASAPEKK
jgi:hypothetical protein